MSTVRLLDRFLFRFLGVPLPAKPYTRKPKTITLKKPAPKEEASTPVMTYGSFELSAQLYNTPNLVKTPEQIKEFQEKELAREKAKAAEREAYVKNYQRDYSANAASYRPDFGRQFGGIGLMSKERREEWALFEAQEKAREKMEKARQKAKFDEIFKNASPGRAPIKVCSN